MFDFGYIDLNGSFVSKKNKKTYPVSQYQDCIAFASKGYVAFVEGEKVLKLDSMPYKDTVSQIGMFVGCVSDKNTAAITFSDGDIYVEKEGSVLKCQTFGGDNMYGALCFDIPLENEDFEIPSEFDVLYIECTYKYDDKLEIGKVSNFKFL